MQKSDFGSDFHWGVSTSAYQVEGAYNEDGRGPSIWDVFSNKNGKVKNNHNGNSACNFYHLYEKDLHLLRLLGIPNFRFSFSWPRVLPNGYGEINQKGLDFYDRMIDWCLQLGIMPWATLYHWDLPEALQQKGGWVNRNIIEWFASYTELCARRYGDRVKHWMVLNEPMTFTGAGYFLGLHAPGKKGLANFLPAVHHAALAQSIGGNVLRLFCPGAEIGTTFSISPVEPHRAIERDINAAARIDALLNRLFIEPVLGLGYPLKDLPFLQRLQDFHLSNDDKTLPFDFDFIGLQYYTRHIARHSFFTPLIRAAVVPAKKRNVPATELDWEVHPAGLCNSLKAIGKYAGVKKIYVTENGAAFPDLLTDGIIVDEVRVHYLQNHLNAVLNAKAEGVNVKGYFIWSFLDNFEWAEGYLPRFGLVYVDFETQKRLIKKSGVWFSNFLREAEIELLNSHDFSLAMAV